jgi:hypothetical protein
LMRSHKFQPISLGVTLHYFLQRREGLNEIFGTIAIGFINQLYSEEGGFE